MNPNATLIGQMIAFAIFVAFCVKFVWPPIINALRERQANIADGLAAAERGRREHELSEERAKEVLKEAKVEASKILSLAQNQGDRLIEEAKETAMIEHNRIVQSGHTEVQQELNQAKQALREQVASISLAAAERILEREVDVKAHSDVLDDLAAQI
ncbi:MAG: F0F1 ATP synthase subunit B [Gammaproteobacteria bacterium]|nr:F0F1 ATP synthase subunit B [Gammaproteobacteria bacterium]